MPPRRPGEFLFALCLVCRTLETSSICLPEKYNPEQDFGCTREDTRKAAEIPEGMADLGPEVCGLL